MSHLNPNYPTSFSDTTINSHHPSHLFSKINVSKIVFPNISPLNSQSLYHSLHYSLYSHNLENHSLNFCLDTIISLFSDNIIDQKQALLFSTFCNNRGLFKFAFTFNDILEYVLETHNTTELSKLCFNPLPYFVELFDNPYLSDDNVTFLLSELDTELHNTMSYINNNYNDVNYHQQSHNICINEHNPDAIISMHLKNTKLTDTVYTVDVVQDQPQICCFEIIQLIKAILNPQQLNPCTQQPFSHLTIDLVYQRFPMQLAMYSRYLELLD